MTPTNKPLDEYLDALLDAGFHGEFREPSPPLSRLRALIQVNSQRALSIVAGRALYSSPRHYCDDLNEYSHVEVGLIVNFTKFGQTHTPLVYLPKPWEVDNYLCPSDDVFGYVPKEALMDIAQKWKTYEGDLLWIRRITAHKALSGPIILSARSDGSIVSTMTPWRWLLHQMDDYLHSAALESPEVFRETSIQALHDLGFEGLAWRLSMMRKHKLGKDSK